MSKYKKKQPFKSKLLPLAEPKRYVNCPRCKGTLLKVRTEVKCINCGFEAAEEQASREANETFHENKGKVWGR